MKAESFWRPEGGGSEAEAQERQLAPEDVAKGRGHLLVPGKQDQSLEAVELSRSLLTGQQE